MPSRSLRRSLNHVGLRNTSTQTQTTKPAKRAKEMNTEETNESSLCIRQEHLLAFVREMIVGRTGREDDEHPLPPGPWDPVIRVALERINVFGPHPEPWRRFLGHPVPWRTVESVFGPSPEPWRAIFASILARHPEIWDAIGGGQNFGEEVALNPQPLPPRFAFLISVAKTVISRAELMQEIADATRREGEQQGIIIVSGYLDRFVDDWCGNDFRLLWPGPDPLIPWWGGPRPKWFVEILSGIDLVVIATQFEQEAKVTFSQDLRQNLVGASAKLVEAGISKMQ